MGSRFQVVITGLVGGALGEYSISEHTMINLVNLLRELRNHRELALQHIWSCFLIEREDAGREEGIEKAKDIIIGKIAVYWSVKVTQKQLEPKTDVEWEEPSDLKLPYVAKKLPIIKKEHKTVVTTSTLEEQLEAGKFDVD